MSDFSINIFLKDEKRYILLVFLIALLIRLFFIFNYSAYLIPVKDAVFYDNTALSILKGKGIVDTKGNAFTNIPPLYSLFLSIIYFIFGHNYIVVRIIQSILYALICIFVFLTSKYIYGKPEAYLASLITAIWPAFILFSYYGGPGFILTETLFIFLLTTLVFYISKIEHFSIYNCAIIGIITGLLILTRFIAVIIFLIFTLYILLFEKKIIFKFLFVLLIGIFLVLSPWIIRNYRVTHKVSLLSNNELTSLLSLFVATFSDLESKWHINAEELGRAVYEGRDYQYVAKAWNIDERKVNAEIKKKIFNEVLKYPLRYFKMLSKNMKIFWSPYYNPIKNQGLIKFNFIYAFIIPFVVLGFFISILKRNKKSLFSFGLILGFTFIHLITVSCERYRYPIEPLLIIFASAGFFYLIRIFPKTRQRIILFSSIVIFFIINVVAYFNSDFTVKLLSGLIP